MSARLTFVDVTPAGFARRRVHTRVVAVVTEGGRELGKIAWLARRRRYAFFCDVSTVWDTEGLREVAEQCRALTAQHHVDQHRRAERVP